MARQSAGLLTDRTITSLSGASQALLAANGQRNYLLIENTGNANVGINLVGGTAIIGGAGTVTLTPNGSLEFVNWIPQGAITVIGTSGQALACLEG